jgi:tRNA(Ile)-lysidine synthetase-like protein
MDFIISLIGSIIIGMCLSAFVIGNMGYETGFQHLLEFPDKYLFNTEILTNAEIEKEQLYIVMDIFCKRNNIYKNGVIISLSGGVDSMVTLSILKYLQQKYKFPLYTATVDYGLRNDSHEESAFLIEYTKHFNIPSYIVYINNISRKKEDSGSRTEFEEESRNKRFDLYKQIMLENGLNTGVFVAHHMDDIIENIFTNSMRGGNIMDLEVMKDINTIHGVKLFRPFLEFKKDVIYKFAHNYNIPYFKDTTPEWSKRGLMRNKIFPLLDDVFGKIWRDKLKYIGEQSNYWGQYIEEYIIIPWYNEVKYEDNHMHRTCLIPIKNQPKIVYSNLIMKVLHGKGMNMIKRTSIDKIMELIQKRGKNLVTLDGNRIATLNQNYLVIMYK